MSAIRTFTRPLAATASMSAMMAALAVAQPAGAAGECGAEGASADSLTCAAASYPTGITYVGSDGLTLNLNNPAMTVLQNAGNGAVDLEGSGTDLTVNATDFTSITGTGTAGIYVSQAGAGNAAVIIAGGAISSTTGNGVVAMTSGAGDASINMTDGSVASGTNSQSYGLYASAASGNAQVTFGGGNVTTTASSGYGLYATSATGNATVTVTDGTVSTSGSGSHDAYALTTGTGTATVVMNGGTITNTGTGNGLRAESGNGLSVIRMTGGNVTGGSLVATVLATNNNSGTGTYDISITGGTVNGGRLAAVQGYSTAPGGVITIGPDAVINAQGGVNGTAILLSGLNAAGGTVTTAGTITGKISFRAGTTNTLNITGGSIAGNYVGGGTDTLNFDLGNGSFNYDAAYTITGVTSVAMNSGTATLGTAMTADAVTVTGGTLVLAGAINTPAFALNGGELSVASDAALGTGAGDLNFNGGLLQVTGTAMTSTTRTISLGANGGGFDIADAGNVFTVSQTLASGGALTKTGAGTLILSGVNGYTGGTILNAGNLSVSQDANLGAASGALTFNGGVLENTAGFTMSRDVVTNAGGANFQTDANLVLSGVVSGSGALTKTGVGSLILTGAGTYTGGTMISAGTIQIGNGGTSGSISGNVTDNAALLFDRSDTMTFAGGISGGGDVRQTGSGTTILTGNSSYTGTTYITDGAIQVSDGGMVSGTSYTEVGTRLIVTGAGSAFTDIGDLVTGRGLGTATITVDNGAHLTTGRSFLGEGSNQSTSSAINITVNGAGSIWDAGDFLQLSAAAGGTASLTVSNGGVMTTAADGSGAIGRGGDGTALVTGAGSQFLSGDLLYIGTSFNGGTGNGQLTIQDGGLVTASTVALGYNDGVSIGNNGTLTVLGTPGARGVLETASLSKGYDDASATFDGGALRASANSTDFISSYGGDYVTIGAGGMFIDTNGFDVTASSGLAGAGALTKQGGGTLILSGDNSYAGGTIIDTGVLQLGDGGTGGSILGDVVDNGTLVFNRSDAVVFPGLISGTGAVIQSGTGITVLTGTDTYTGGTTIGAGTLQVGNGSTAGSIAGDVTDNGALVFDRSDAVNFAGVIGGSGTVTQAGAGNLTLAGANTYSGGTVIGTGTGTVTGSATSFGSGAITDNAALVIDQATDATFADAVNGSGSFTKKGAGRLNYTGIGTLSGPTTVTAGLLSVNGSLASSAVMVAGGATLGGNGTVGATTILSGGTVAPGNSIGTLHINGNFIQNAGSTYQVEVNPGSSASDMIAVNGAATIANGATLNVTKNPPGDYGLNAQYTVLMASGGISGNYATTGDAAVSQYLALEEVQDAKNIYLRVVQTGDPASAAQTSNQVATATGTGSLPSSNTVSSAILNTPDPNATRAAFDALSGEAQASAKGVLVASSVLVRDTTFDRLRDMFCTGAQDSAASNRPAGCGANADRPSVWAQGFGDWGHIYGNANAASISQTTGGFLVGVDAPVGDWRAGVFGGYSRTDFTVTSRGSSGTSDNYHLGVYGGTAWDDLKFRLGASYSWSGIDTNHLVAFDNFSNDLQAGYSAGTAQVFGEIGQQFHTDRISLEPFVNLAYVSLHADGFSEVGGDAALTSSPDTTQDIFTTIGIRPSIDMTLGSTNAVVRGMVGWRHTFDDITPSSMVSFTGGKAFAVEGAPIAENVGVVEAGLDVDVTRDTAVAVTYGGQFSDRETDHSVRGTLTVSF